MTELIQEQFISSLGHGGRYFSSPNGITLFNGPPIETFRFTLEEDDPEWSRVDPRDACFRPRRLRRQAITLIGRRQDSSAHVPKERPFSEEHGQRALRDMMWLERMIGRKLWRISSRVPIAANPYLLIWFSHRIPEYADLLSSAPMLAVMIAQRPVVDPDVIGLDDLIVRCRKEALMPRRNIAENRGFPSNTVGGLTKIIAAGADPRLARRLAKMLKDPLVRKRFNHMPVIGPDAVRFFSDERLLGRVTGRFMRLLAKWDQRQSHARFALMLDDFLMLLELGESRGHRKVFTSPEQLADWYDTTCSHIIPKGVDRLRRVRFRAAPVNGIPGFIEQILTGEQLISQAVVLQQCCADEGYVEMLREGYTYLFRAGGFGLPECTIEVEPIKEDDERNRRHAVTQVAGKNNMPLSAQNLAAIRVWAKGEGMKMYASERCDHQAEMWVWQQMAAI